MGPYLVKFVNGVLVAVVMDEERQRGLRRFSDAEPTP